MTGTCRLKRKEAEFLILVYQKKGKQPFVLSEIREKPMNLRGLRYKKMIEKAGNAEALWSKNHTVSIWRLTDTGFRAAQEEVTS